MRLPSSETNKRMLSRYQQSFALFLLVLLSGKVLALSNYSFPIVTLPYGSFQGKVVGDLVQHLGIPFAAPPYVNNTCPILITRLGAVFDLGSHRILYPSMGFVKQQLSELHVPSKILHLELCLAM